MTTPSPNFAEELDLLVRAVAEPVAQMILVEFESEPVLREAAARLFALGQPRTHAVVRFDYAERDAARLLARARAKLETDASASGSPPLLLVAETIRVTSGREDVKAREFWRQMNFLRESWGSLHAQILLWVTPWSQRLLREWAADLRDWMNLRVTLHGRGNEVLPADLLTPSPLAYPDLQLSPGVVESVIANLRNDFWSERRDPEQWARFVGNHGLSFLSAVLSAGMLKPARDLRDATVVLGVEPHDTARWHELNFVLELASELPSAADDHARSLIEQAQSGLDVRRQERALQAIIRLTDLGVGLQSLTDAAPLIESVRARYDPNDTGQQFTWSRLGIAAELLRIAAGQPTPQEQLDFYLPQTMDASSPERSWPDWDALCRLALLDARRAMHQIQSGDGDVFWPVFELRGSPTRLAMRAAHACLLVNVAVREGAPALRQYDWVLPAAEEVFSDNHAETGILRHHFSLLHEYVDDQHATRSNAAAAAHILNDALGSDHPATIAVIARSKALEQIDQ